MAEVNVRGLRELHVLFAAVGKEAKKDLNAELRSLAEPIRMDAESLAASTITRIGPRWSRMRTGVTRKLVYVAPRQRGTRSRDDRRSRPRFADLMERRAMRPALERNRAQIEQRTEAVFDRISAKWNRKA